MKNATRAHTKQTAQPLHHAGIQKNPAPKTRLTRVYRSSEKSSETAAADNAIDATQQIANAAKNQQELLEKAHHHFSKDLQDAVVGFAASAIIGAAASAAGVPPLYFAIASVLYGVSTANAAPVAEATANTWVWNNKFHESNPLGGICTARHFADICGRSNLNTANGTNILPAVTREINAHTTSEGFTWGGWFTLRDCFTKTKVQNTIVSVLETLGLDKALNPGQLCSFSSPKFQETLVTSSVVGLSSEACNQLTSNLNLISQKCSDGVRAGAIDFGLAVGGIAACIVGLGVCLCGYVCYSNVREKLAAQENRVSLLN